MKHDSVCWSENGQVLVFISFIDKSTFLRFTWNK